MKTRSRWHAAPALLEVRVAQIEQLFNSIDPSPFVARDLDQAAEDYIIEAAKEQPRDAALALHVHLDQWPADREALAQVGQAIQAHFAARATTTRRRLSELFQRGRVSLLIGLVFLSLSIAAGEFSKSWLSPGGLSSIVRESLLIGGWVAMWRPMEIFLYDWWPMARHIRLLDRLAAMGVRVAGPRASHGPGSLSASAP